jgi:taurine dioxygenase
MFDDPGRTQPAPFMIRPLSDTFAAEISGLDLRNPLDATLRQAVLDALVRHKAICFRDQSLTGEQQVAFTQQFGPLELFTIANRGVDNPLPLLNIVSNLGKDGKPTGNLETRRWHTDKSFLATPCFATILHPVILPPAGGETCFADMHAAYEALSAREKAELENVRVVHSREYSMRRAGKVPTPQEIEDAGPPMAHPLVRINPFSGCKGLFMGEHASHLEGQEDAGRAPIDALGSLCYPGAVRVPPCLAQGRRAHVGQRQPAAPRRRQLQRRTAGARPASHLSERHAPQGGGGGGFLIREIRCFRIAPSKPTHAAAARRAPPVDDVSLLKENTQ